MVVEFSVDVEVAEGDRVVGLLQELRGSGAALCVPVGMRRLMAMAVTMTEPLKRAGPVLSLMHGTSPLEPLSHYQAVFRSKQSLQHGSEWLLSAFVCLCRD